MVLEYLHPYEPKLCHKARNPSLIILTRPWNLVAHPLSLNEIPTTGSSLSASPAGRNRETVFKHNPLVKCLVKGSWRLARICSPACLSGTAIGKLPWNAAIPYQLAQAASWSEASVKSTPTSPPTLLRKPLHLELGCGFLQAKGIQNYADGCRAEEQITRLKDFTLRVSGGGSIPIMTWLLRHLRRKEWFPSRCHATWEMTNQKNTEYQFLKFHAAANVFLYSSFMQSKRVSGG